MPHHQNASLLRPSQVIAIDGPSGSGKSTIARELARHLGLLYIDTGAMFRALAFMAHQENIPLKEGPELEAFLRRLKLEYGVSPEVLIKANGVDLTEKIREHHVSQLASAISQLPSVRAYLLDFQRKEALDKMCVMEGRDIGTVVFPRAFCKIFITAGVEVRAQRRLAQLREQGNESVTLSQVAEDVKKRDESDMKRAVAPLKQADDAWFVDTSALSQNEVVELLAKEVERKARECGLTIGEGR